MVTAAPRVMMRDALVRDRRHLILIAVEMVCCLRSHRDTVEPLRRMRRSACPQHKDKHQRAKERSPTMHQRRR